MRPRYVIGAGLILGAFVVIALVAYFANQELYLTVDELVANPALYAAPAATGTSADTGPDGVVGAAQAAESNLAAPRAPSAGGGRRYQVRGTVDYATVERPREGLEMRFTLTGRDARLPVLFHGVVPDSFDQAEVVTVAGRVGADGTFVADDLLVQCPSKYEAVPPGVPTGTP